MVDRLVNSEANKKRIQFVEQCFGSSGQPLLVPGRVLVGEGVLTKLCRKKAKQRQFFLFNDILVYGNVIISKKKYNSQHVLALEDVRIHSVDDEGEYRNGWQIISPSKSFVVYAATATEKTEWMAHINKCVHDLLAKSGKSATADASPVWIPDSDAKQCMHCNKTQFSLINRRHHCRKCGKVVCNDCSQNKWLFPQQSIKPQRVCTSCYKTLASSMTGMTPVSAATVPQSDDSSDSSDDESDNHKPDDEAMFYQGEHQNVA